MNLVFSIDRELLDISLIHEFLSTQSTWARGISYSTVVKSIANSLCFGVYIESKQVAFARVITDYATFANLVDVIVFPEFRGRGISKQLISYILEYRNLSEIRRFTLATSDAHGLYEKFGFSLLSTPQTFMERYHPNVYRKDL